MHDNPIGLVISKHPGCIRITGDPPQRPYTSLNALTASGITGLAVSSLNQGHQQMLVACIPLNEFLTLDCLLMRCCISLEYRK